MRHIIKKQVIEIKLNSRKDAFLIQQEFHSLYWNRIIPELERIFDRLSNEREIIEIDKLEVELGDISLSSFNSQIFFDTISRQISNAVKEKVRVWQQQGQHQNGNGITRQWLFYMEKGYLDWNTVSTGEEWYRLVLEGLATDYNSITLLRKLARSNKPALQRMASNHDDVFLVHLVEVLSASRQDVLHEVIHDLEKIMSFLTPGASVNTVIDQKIIKRKLWQELIEYCAGQPAPLNSKTVVGHAIDWLVREQDMKDWLQIATRVKTRTFQQYLIEKIKCSQEMKEKEGKDHERINKLIDSGHNGEIISGKAHADFEKKFSEKVKTGEEQSPVQLALEEIKGANETGIKDAGENEQETVIGEIFSWHAGLVLLHPFLASLFTRLTLFIDGKFVDAAAQERAIHILYYLATGREDPEEFELVIPKFLAGYPIEHLLNSPIYLTEAEKEEITGLLEVVIDKWKILGNTSPATLQASFLQRKGKLVSRNEKLYLQVEMSSIDVLLDHLPWNLSIIKLPWMKDLLRVEWR